MIPGLFDKKIEFFVFQNDLYAFIDGDKVSYSDFSFQLKREMKEFYLSSGYQKILENESFAGDVETETIEFFKCRYGGMDLHPDGCTEDKDYIGNAEYWPCPKRGSCSMEGNLCHIPGKLTKREIEIINLFKDNIPDKQIADKLHIAYTTLVKHKSNIFRKLKLNKTAAVVTWAFENKIISSI